MGIREKKKVAIRKSILRASRQVFAEKGFYNASVSDIIRQTNLARGTFYLYYQNKEEIFAELTAILFRYMLADIKRTGLTRFDNEADYQAVLEKLALSLFRTFEKHGEMIKIFLNSPMGVEPNFDKQLQTYIDVLLGSIQELARKYHEKQIIDFPDARLLSWIIYGAIREIIYQRQIRNRDSSDPAPEIRQIVSLFLFGIAKRKP